MFTSFLVSTAFAQTATQGPKNPSLIDMLILPAGFLLIMYFFMIRPQQRKAREHENMVAGLKAGDEVVTSGGIIGRIRSVAKDEGFVGVEIANNVIVKVMKAHVAGLTKVEAAKVSDKAK